MYIPSFILDKSISLFPEDIWTILPSKEYTHTCRGIVSNRIISLSQLNGIAYSITGILLAEPSISFIRLITFSS